MLVGRAPLRISFAGGGTDLEEYHNNYDGYTVSFTINKYTWVMAKPRQDKLVQGFSPDFALHLPPTKHTKLKEIQGHEIVIAGLKEMKFSNGVDMYLGSDVKPNSGLGASSSLTSNLVNVIIKLQNKKSKKQEIAKKAYHIGHDILKWGIGKQDEYAAVYGGLNLFKYTKEKVLVKPIKLNQNTLQELQKNSMLFRMGERKHSVNILQKQIKNMKNPKTMTLEALHQSKNLAIDVKDALKNNDLERFSELINKGWEIKKQFAEGVSNPHIEKISKIALKNGAKSLKVTGAGGGGHMFIYAEPKKHKLIEKNLKKNGVEKVDFRYQTQGVKAFNIMNL